MSMSTKKEYDGPPGPATCREEDKNMSEEKQYKPCPYCKEDILEDAVKCRHCQSMLGPTDGSSLTGRSPDGLFVYPRAGLGKRFIAWLVDMLIAGLGIVFFLFFILLSGIGSMFFMRGGFRPGVFPSTPGSYGLPEGLVAPGIFLLIILAIGLASVWGLIYTLLKDGLGRGQSLGKRLTGLMVIKLENSEPCTFGVSALRNLTLILQNLVPHVGFLIEPIVTLVHERGQRLGDLLANTQVIEVDQYREPEG